MKNDTPKNGAPELTPMAGEIPPAFKPLENECFLIFAFDYPKVGRSGGWSKSAKHRPAPVLNTSKLASLKDNKRRKFTAFDLATTPATLIRRDYSLEEIRKLGGIVPEIYFDELGNMRGLRDELIMAGPLLDPAGTFQNPATGAIMKR